MAFASLKKRSGFEESSHRRSNNLKGHLAIQFYIPRLIDRAHPSFAQNAHNHESAEPFGHRPIRQIKRGRLLHSSQSMFRRCRILSYLDSTHSSRARGPDRAGLHPRSDSDPLSSHARNGCRTRRSTGPHRTGRATTWSAGGSKVGRTRPGAPASLGGRRSLGGPRRDS